MEVLQLHAHNSMARALTYGITLLHPLISSIDCFIQALQAKNNTLELSHMYAGMFGNTKQHSLGTLIMLQTDAPGHMQWCYSLLSVLLIIGLILDFKYSPRSLWLQEVLTATRMTWSHEREHHTFPQPHSLSVAD